MKVKCIKEVEKWRACRDITVGKTYRVDKKEDECYYLRDNTGQCWWYEEKLFKIKTKNKYTKKQIQEAFKTWLTEGRITPSDFLDEEVFDKMDVSELSESQTKTLISYIKKQ